jgi:uncharacterized membrane protein YphA (DoxX/SURF4 family)
MKMENKHSSFLWVLKIVFFTMFIYSAYKKLRNSLSFNEKKKESRSYALMPDKGVLGTVKEILKAK